MSSTWAAPDRLRSLVHSGALDLPRPASGRTWERWEALRALAGEDLSLARLAEGHVDAVAVLIELGRGDLVRGCLGVWAAGPPGAVEAEAVAGGWRLSGARRWCSGAGALDSALVRAAAGDGERLFLVDLGAPGVVPIAGTWPAIGMAATDSLDVAFDGVRVTTEAVVGSPGSYLGRPGFWHGAAGVAACWHGGALAVAERLRLAVEERPDEHRLAHLGAVDAALEASRCVLRQTAETLDRSPADLGLARRGALRARQVVHDGCWTVLRLTGRATGPGPLCHEPGHARRVADLEVYLGQHHGESDQAALGRLAVEGWQCTAGPVTPSC